MNQPPDPPHDPSQKRPAPAPWGKVPEAPRDLRVVAGDWGTVRDAPSRKLRASPGWGKLRDIRAKLHAPPGWGKVVAQAQAKFKSPPGWGKIREFRAKLHAPPGWGKLREFKVKLKVPAGWGKLREPKIKIVVSPGWGTDPAPVPESSAGGPRWKVILACIFILAGLGAGIRSYLINDWEQKHLLRQARVYLQFNDEPALRIVFEKLLDRNPRNEEACRIWAESLTKHANRDAVIWCRRVVELVPDSQEDRQALAQALLRFDYAADVALLLEGAETQAGSDVDHQEFAADVLERSGLLAVADAHYAEALRLAPVNPLVLLRLERIRLYSREPSVREKALVSIERLSSDSRARVPALRELISDALRDHHAERALSMAERLLSTPGHDFEDRLLCLQALQAVGSPDFPMQLTGVQKDAAGDMKTLEILLAWMNANNLAGDAGKWAFTLPNRVTAPPMIQIRIAESFAGRGDWTGLEAFISKADWGDMDYMKHAFLSRCQGEKGNRVLSRSTWEDAMTETPNTGEALKMFALSASKWGTDTNAVDALWRMAGAKDNAAEALKLLYCRYLANRDTDGLYRVAFRMVESDPANDPARNSLALFSLLLKRDATEAFDTARALYEKEPANWSYAVTYAYALYCHGQKKFAADILGRLGAGQQQEPSVAAYYSVILEGGGRQEEAQRFRRIAQRARLLPEEEQLLTTVEAK